MKVENTIMPTEAFVIEIRDLSMVYITFNDLATVTSEVIGDETRYMWDSYNYRTRNREGLAESIQDNYNDWLTLAHNSEAAELANKIRKKRNVLLTACDWTQTLDVSLSQECVAAFRAYRQALKDIPEQEGFPYNVVFPEEPMQVKAESNPVDEAFDELISGV